MWESLIPILPWMRDLLDNRITTAWIANLQALYTALIGRAAYLDKLNITGNVAGSEEVTVLARADDPLLSAPIAGGIVGSAESYIGGISFLAGPTTTSYETVVDYNGAGVLNLAALYCQGSGTNSASLRVTINGVAQVTTCPGTASRVACVAGVFVIGGTICLDQIPFHTSIKVEHKKDSAGTSVMQLALKLRKTA